MEPWTWSEISIFRAGESWLSFKEILLQATIKIYQKEYFEEMLLNICLNFFS